MDIEYLAKGGFSTVYKAKWNNYYCFKILNDSKKLIKLKLIYI